MLLGMSSSADAVDKCYRPQAFAPPGSGTGAGDAKRVEFLFELYGKYVAGLLAKPKLKGKK